MSMNTSQLVWPFDELSFKRVRPDSLEFLIATPWLTLKIDVDPADVGRASQLADKFSSQTLSAEDVPELNWLLSPFKEYPLAYWLPRGEEFGSDFQQSKANLPLSWDVHELLRYLIQKYPSNKSAETLIEKYIDVKWTWDSEAALAFSAVAGGHDPYSVFSIARRFHLLNDIENNRTAELFSVLKNTSNSPQQFSRNSALVMRQNHYITQKCEWALTAAFENSGKALGEVEEFVSAEAGHDKIIEKALDSMGQKANDVPVFNSTLVLMDLFHWIAKNNFLAFAMVVDIFERTSYMESDPFAQILNDGGQRTAAKKIEIHREINDMGGHENVAVGFLSHMRPVSAAYASESLRLAELLTMVIHLVSRESIDYISNLKS